jgi:ATP-dependent RNA circularization protein (DNA/RNA ligase family)
MKYYLALLKNLIEDYQNSNTLCSDIIACFSDNSKKLPNYFSTYLHSRIVYLKIQNYEKMEKKQDSINISNEITDHLESLFETVKKNDDNLSVKIGLKMSFYLKITNKPEDYIKLLELIMNIIHKQMISGKLHPNLINQFLYFSSLLAYNNTLLSNLSEFKFPFVASPNVFIARGGALYAP